MNIALFMRRTELEKEATHITINALAEELKKKNNVYIVRGRTIREYISEFRKLKENINIIHGFSAAPLLSLSVITARFFQPHAKTVYTLKSYSRHALGSVWFSSILNFVNAVTVPTHIFAEKLKKHGLRSKKVHIIRSSLDTKKFVPKNKEELKKKYGYKKCIVLYYGSLFESKGVKYLIEASDKINAEIIIAPRHKPAEAFLRAVKDKNVKIVPEINVVDYVNLADIIVLPYSDLTSTEGNPSCMLEAVACKTAVVTTDLPELRELFSDDEITFVPPKNSDALANAVNELLSDDKRRKHLTENAHKKIKEFDITKIVQEFEALYELIAQRD